MLKHMKDGGDLNMLIITSEKTHEDALLVACKECKETWLFTPTESEASAREVRAFYKTALRTSPALLEELGIDKETIARLEL